MCTVSLLIKHTSYNTEFVTLAVQRTLLSQKCLFLLCKWSSGQLSALFVALALLIKMTLFMWVHFMYFIRTFWKPCTGLHFGLQIRVLGHMTIHWSKTNLVQLMAKKYGSGYGTTHGSSCFKTYSTMLPSRLAWCGSNKKVSLSSLNRRRSGNLRDRLQLYYINGSGFTSRLGVLHFRNSDCLHVSIRWTSFSLLF